MATGDNTRLGSLPASVANEARRDPSRSGRPAKSCLRRGPCEGIIAKEHGRTRAGDAQEVRPSTQVWEAVGVWVDRVSSQVAGWNLPLHRAHPAAAVAAAYRDADEPAVLT